MATITQRVTFPGSLSADLAARLDLPDGTPRAFALFAHCFTCSKDVFAASRIAAEMVDLGFGVLRFDFTGLGSSDGEFANTNFSSNTLDVKLAADWLAENHGSPSLLIGHSLGGAAVLAVAGDIDDVTAVVTIGAPSAVDHIEHLLGDAVETIEELGEAEVELAGRTFSIRRQFLDDIRNTSLEQRVAEMGKALLIMHSPVDTQVRVENAAALYGAARHPKSFIALDGADHLLTRKEDAIYAAKVISAWVGPYLPSGQSV